MAVAEQPIDIRAVLNMIGATPAAVAALLDGLNDDALRAATSGGRSCLDLLEAFVRASQRLGTVAHDVLGHVPAASGAVQADVPPRVDGAQLQSQLRFLREHIVSTVDQQGAEVWFSPTPAGRPLVAYAVDLVHEDETLLATLRQAVVRARTAQPGGV